MIGNAVDAAFTPDGPAAEGEYVLAVGTLEPRKNLQPRRAGRADRRLGAPRRRRARLGRRLERELARRGATTRSSRASTAAPSASPSRRSTRASGSPCSRRWPAARRSSPSRDGATAEVAGDAAVLVDPLDVGVDRGRIARGDRTPRRAARAGSRPRPRLHLERRRGRHGRRVEGDRVKLVAIDADVLGRRRTGDETYVLNLLRALAPLAPESGLRFAAITRHPELVPAGIEPVELSTRVAGAAHGRDAAASPPPARRRARPLPVRTPAAAALPGRRHDPRPLLRARPVADEP